MAEPSLAPRPVLFVHYGQDWIRGSERCLLDLVANLDRTRYAPIVWCNAETLAASARAAGATVYHEPTVAGGERTPALVGRVAWRALTLVRRHGVRLIHANDMTPFPSLVGAARLHRIPLLAHMHLIPTEPERRWALLHQATLAVGVSRASVVGLAEDGMPADRITVVHNGVDVDALAAAPPSRVRHELGIAPTALVATVVASLIDRKGIDVVIRALAALRARGRDVHLLLCGDGVEEQKLRALAARLGVADAAHFLGVRADVGAILNGSTDVLVSAARLEAFALNLLEGAACGVPAVVSDIAPHVEGVIDGVTGLVVATDDSAAFAEALARLADDPPLRRTLGDNARARVRSSFTLSRWVRDLDRIYTELMARPRRTLGIVRGSTWPPGYTTWLRSAVTRRLAIRPLGSAEPPRPTDVADR
ncbi:MAG: hypothetical protein AVDCRST_MAG40-3393 [uncultured Gemmatimonadaceae bacterium]|uniref:Glycosyltransferase n=1 Tax=uncultured Gemmatimonadaceae bacterium TaxID=246130 RepID=A0A6J4MHT0_9BACT|nr:MAG: hypothetical protein AVDCRST_MAG40-3393 [uncultured Gemmatimonadaceae bacterium]